MSEEKSAMVTGRALLVGKLILEAPLLISAGAENNRDDDRDIRVLQTKDGNPFIPGTSLCGVLREFLIAHADTDSAKMMFGDSDGGQSMINIDDVVLKNGQISFRDGVCIDGITGVGVDNAKYDYEVVEPGASGELRVLLTRRQYHEKDWDEIRDCFLLLKDKMEDGVTLGAVTAKGFGKVRVEDIHVGFYDFRKPEDIRTWLMQDDPLIERASDSMRESSTKSIADDGDLEVEAHFSLRSSVIVRDYGREKVVPNAKKKGKTFDAVSLMREDGTYILPGTSLKGVLRHRAEHILWRLGVDDSFLRDLMGYSEKGNDGEDKKSKSRFMVEESALNRAALAPAGQTRIRIDRFTGGVIDSALLVNEPLWQKEADKKAFTLRFKIRKVKQDREVGLALYLLRDLWQGKVAIGGEKSIGRGTLQGLGATIRYKGKTYEIGKGGKVTEGEQEELEKYAENLRSGEKKEAAAE